MGILFAFVSAFAFSISYIFIQKGMKTSKGDNGLFITILMNVLTLSILFLIFIFIKHPFPPFSLSGILFFVLAGFLTTFLGRATLFASIRKMGSSKAVAIKNTAPLFTVMSAIFLIGENISLWGGIGICILLSALFIQARNDYIQADKNEEGTRNKIGLLLAVASAVSFGIGHLVRKQGILLYADPVVGSLIGSVLALLAFVVTESWNKRLGVIVKSNVTSINFFFIMAGIVTSLAQLSFFIAIFYTNVSYVSVIAATEPVLTVFLCKLFLNLEEKISIRLGITACVIFLGSCMVVLGK